MTAALKKQVSIFLPLPDWALGHCFKDVLKCRRLHLPASEFEFFTPLAEI
jgi:hypothetical protein